MTSNELVSLPIGIDELLSHAVEGARLELKATWDGIADATASHVPHIELILGPIC